MKKQNLQLLSDDQVRRFIADGFIIVDSQLDATFHQQMARDHYLFYVDNPHLDWSLRIQVYEVDNWYQSTRYHKGKSHQVYNFHCHYMCSMHHISRILHLLCYYLVD